jgi:hypothetical protein
VTATHEHTNIPLVTQFIRQTSLHHISIGCTARTKVRVLIDVSVFALSCFYSSGTLDLICIITSLFAQDGKLMKGHSISDLFIN